MPYSKTMLPGRKIESAAMIATAKDSLSDTFSTMVVLASALAAHFWKIPIDGYCGFLVGVMILIAGITAMKDTVSPLLGQAPEPELVDEIEKIVRCDKRILGIHDLVVHDYGPGRLMVSLHAEVPYKEDILELHDLIDQIEFSLRKKLNCEPVIHMDPIVDDDEETNAVKARITEIIESLNKDSRKNENVQFHDFRMVKRKTRPAVMRRGVSPAAGCTGQCHARAGVGQHFGIDNGQVAVCVSQHGGYNGKTAQVSKRGAKEGRDLALGDKVEQQGEKSQYYQTFFINSRQD